MLKLDKQERFRQRYKQMRPGYQPALAVYKERMSELIDEDTRLLDVGCGPGGLVTDAVGLAKLVVGLDRNVSSFRSLAELQTLVEADLDRLPFADNTFDLVTCSWVLEHISAPQAALGEVARVLRPGGSFLFITPNKRNYVVRLRQLIPNLVSQRIVRAIYARDEAFINPTYYRANTYQDIDRVLRQAGMQCQVFYHIGDPSYLAVNDVMFRVSVLIERLIDRLWPQGRVHLVGLYVKNG